MMGRMRRTTADAARTAERRSRTGSWGESTAAKVLEARGWEVIERNWRPTPGPLTPRGELDLICFDGAEYVACEVKTRTTLGYGHPLEAIDHGKATRLRLLARNWASSRPGARIRVDAVAITGGPAQFTFEHLENVV